MDDSESLHRKECLRLVDELKFLFSECQSVSTARENDMLNMMDELERMNNELKSTQRELELARKELSTLKGAREAEQKSRRNTSTKLYPPLEHPERQSLLSDTLISEEPLLNNTPQRILANPIRVAQPVRTWTGGIGVHECEHGFKEITSYLLNKCCVCKKNAGWRCLQCQGCDLTVHHKCKAIAPMPCVPCANPRAAKEGRAPELADYCPELQPRIPSLVIRCVYALEVGGHIGNPGLYRAKIDKQCEMMVEPLSSSCPPLLNKLEPALIVGCLKKFLVELKGSLIPAKSFKQMIRAGSDLDELMREVGMLPAPNRDTLSYLLIHWKKVCAKSSGARSLYSTFGSLVTTDKSGSKQDHAHVLSQLLLLDTEFLQAFVKPCGLRPNAVKSASTQRTPAVTPSRAR